MSMFATITKNDDLDRITDFINREKETKKLTSKKVRKNKKYHGMKIIYSQVKILIYIYTLYASQIFIISSFTVIIFLIFYHPIMIFL